MQKKYLVFGLALVVLFFVALATIWSSPSAQTAPSPNPTTKPSPSPAPTPEPTANIEFVLVSQINNPALNSNATPFIPLIENLSGLTYSLIGGDWSTLDGNSGLGLNTDEPFVMGFKVGFHKGAASIGNCDRYMTLYFEIKLESTDVSPREIPAANLDLSLRDNTGEELKLVYNSFNGEYPTKDTALYGLAMFAVYSDTEWVDFDFGQSTYRLSLSILPLLQ